MSSNKEIDVYSVIGNVPSQSLQTTNSYHNARVAKEVLLDVLNSRDEQVYLELRDIITGNIDPRIITKVRMSVFLPGIKSNLSISRLVKTKLNVKF